MKPRSICLLLSCLLLAGCTRIRIKTGARIPLATLPVTSIAATLPGGPGIAPGEQTPLVVTFLQPDGSTLTTEGAGHGKILWQDLAIVPTVVSISKNGNVSLNSDPRASYGQTGHLDITVPTHLGLHATLDVPVRYDYAYAVSLSGSDGLSGNNGQDGSDGAAGSVGSIDPDHPVAGGNGGNGTSGTNGTDGNNGDDGPDVQVRMALLPAARPLVQVAVSSGRGTERFYLLDPAGGSLTVRSDGGSGGSGGRGGRAGRGGQGGSGSPNGSNGSDGSAGSNGSDGRRGSDGRVNVSYDPAAQPYLGLIKVYTGSGPILSERPSGPLW